MNNKQARALFLTAHNFLKGKPLTESTKVEKLSDLSDDERAKIEDILTRRDKNMPDGMKNRMRNPILMFDKNGEYHGSYKSVSDAEEYVDRVGDTEGWINGPRLVQVDESAEIEEKSSYVKAVEKAMAQEEGYDKEQEFEQDEKGETCIRCGVNLDSEEGLETGICADCWTREDEDDVEESCGKSHKQTMKEALSNEAYELMTFIQNDQDLYKRHIIPSVKNMQRKIAKGTYDHALAPDLWIHTVNAALPQYAEEFNLSLPQVRTSLFPMSVRQEVAQALADEYRDEIDAQGEQMFDEGAYGKKKTMKEGEWRPGIYNKYKRTWDGYYSQLERAQRLFGEKSSLQKGSNSAMAREFAQEYDNFNDEFNEIKELAIINAKNITRIIDIMDDIEYQINMGLYADEEEARDAGVMQP